MLTQNYEKIPNVKYINSKLQEKNQNVKYVNSKFWGKMC